MKPTEQKRLERRYRRDLRALKLRGMSTWVKNTTNSHVGGSEDTRVA